ncbi:MAG: alpha/beta hydrolase [Treponema sp.]|jgi:hypothetical protein|nr:alpha/beta hydrolase [Treponema sp.]
MKRLLVFLGAGVVLLSCATADKGKDNAMILDELALDMDKIIPIERTLTFYDGVEVNYRSYEKIYYVKNVADPAYQYLNLYIPESAYDDDGKTPIFLRNTVGGYMASWTQEPAITDVTGRALREGLIVVIPGVRGWNSTVNQDGESINIPPGSPPPEGAIYTGRAPAAIVDLKAVVRFLRHNDAVMPGNAERIISDGTSAGGALSALLGATGNNPAYEPYLRELGAAEERDDIFAAVCYCPIIDLEHADMAYEWLYQGTNAQARALRPEETAVSAALAALYPAYLNSLGLTMPDGIPLSSANYMAYLKGFLLRSAQKARDAAFDIPEETGVTLNKNFQGAPGELVQDIDMDKYLNYVVARTPLKTPPAFDQLGVLNQGPSAENRLFGDEKGNSANFTVYSIQSIDPSADINTAFQARIDLMNPMYFIGDSVSTITKNWYLRHGSLDRDTAFQIPINLYTKLNNAGYDVDFRLIWNRGHQGDYDLDDLFAWIKTTVKAVD